MLLYRQKALHKDGQRKENRNVFPFRRTGFLRLAIEKVFGKNDAETRT